MAQPGRKPVPGLYPFKFAYNLAQVMLCSYMCIDAGMQAFRSGYSLTPCIAFNHEKPPIGPILYIFYLSKILDFLDTVFIIAEQRWAQLSFLHYYHHFSIFLVSCLAMIRVPSYYHFFGMMLMRVFMGIPYCLKPCSHGPLCVPLVAFVSIVLLAQY
jgi:GNS1/SUR4 family